MKATSARSADLEIFDDREFPAATEMAGPAQSPAGLTNSEILRAAPI